MTKPYIIEAFPSAYLKEEWYVRLRRSGEILMHSQPYTPSNARRAARTLHKNMPGSRLYIDGVEQVVRTIKDSPQEGTIPRAKVQRAVQAVSEGRQ